MYKRQDIADAAKIQLDVDMIRGKNPKAVIVTTPVDRLDGKQLLEIIEKRDTMLDDMLEEVRRSRHQEEECCCGHDHDHGHEGHDHDHECHGHEHEHGHEDHDHDHECHEHDHGHEGHHHDHDHECHGHDHGHEEMCIRDSQTFIIFEQRRCVDIKTGIISMYPSYFQVCINLF